MAHVSGEVEEAVIVIMSFLGFPFTHMGEPCRSLRHAGHLMFINNYSRYYIIKSLCVVQVSKPRCGSVYPWPLNVLLPFKKQWQVKSQLRALGWSQKTRDQVS